MDVMSFRKERIRKSYFFIAFFAFSFAHFTVRLEEQWNILTSAKAG